MSLSSSFNLFVLIFPLPSKIDLRLQFWLRRLPVWSRAGYLAFLSPTFFTYRMGGLSWRTEIMNICLAPSPTLSQCSLNGSCFIIAFATVKSLLSGRDKDLSECYSLGDCQQCLWMPVFYKAQSGTAHYPRSLPSCVQPPKPHWTSSSSSQPASFPWSGHVISLPPHKGHSRAQPSPKLNAGLSLSAASPHLRACAFASNSLQSLVSSHPPPPTSAAIIS